MRVERGRAADPFELIRHDLGMLNRFFGGGLFGEAAEAGPFAMMGNYNVDIHEDADHIYVEADMPGFRKEDIDLTLENGVLTISAERHEEQTEQPRQGKQQGKAEPEATYLLRERRQQQCIRSFTLPNEVDEQSVQARLDNGVLKITLNKREETKPRRIELS
jgi:HSP20 family protein